MLYICRELPLTIFTTIIRSVESVEDFSSMFEFATQFGIDTSIDAWNTRSAKDMTSMVSAAVLSSSLG